MFVATPDRACSWPCCSIARSAGTRFYQTVFYLPVVLSLAVIGIIWRLQYAPEQGFINNVLGRTANNNLIDWLGNPDLNIWAALVATSWRHVGYIMVLYLAGLKAFDPALREAAKVDGANERQTFFRVVFPVMMPINVVIVVITTIEALRAFDIAYIINRGKNGLELLSTLITNNAISESNRLGFGSAIAVVLLVISLGADHRLPDPHAPGRPGMTAIPAAGVRPGGRARRRRTPPRRIALYGFLTVMAAIWLFPLAWARVHRPAAVLRHAGESATSRRRPRSTSTTSSMPGSRATSRPLLEHALRHDPGRDPDAPDRVDGRVRRVALQLAVQPARAADLHRGQPAATAGDHRAALQALHRR